MSGVAGLNIGDRGATSTDRNKVYQMRNGIIARNAATSIYGTDFYDFEGNIADELTDPVADLNQHAVSFFRIFGHIEDNTFDNLMIGIKTLESYVTIHDNEFDIPTGTANPTKTRGIEANIAQNHVITKNIVNDGFKGIVINSTSNPFLIDDNDLFRNLPYGRHAGIEVNFAKLQTAVGQVSNNDLEITDARASIGINFFDCNEITVSYNDIFFDEAINSGPFNAAMAMAEGGNSRYHKNIIDAHESYMDVGAFNSGILSTSDFNNFTCNEMNNFNTLLKIVSDNTMTNLKSNKFNDGYFGLELVAPAMIGIQTHHHNEWLGAFDFGGYISGDIANLVETADLSRFYADGDIPKFIPDDIGPPAVDNGNWFIDEESEDAALNCGNPTPEIDFDEDTLVMLVRRVLDFEDYNTQMTWQVKASIFELLLNTPSLLSNTVLDSFFNAEENTILGQVIAFQNDLALRAGVVEVDKADAEVEILRLAQDIVYIDSVITFNPVSAATWYALRHLKLDTLADEMVIWTGLIEDEYTASDAMYDEIYDDLDLLSPGNDLEDYLISALMLRAKYLSGREVTSGDLTSLIDLCPWEGGRALSVAQGLYAMIADSSMNSTINECTPSSPFVKPGQTNHVVESEYGVYPNPASTEITISNPGGMTDVLLTTLENKVVLSLSPKSETFTIDISHLPVGIYLLSLIREGAIDTHKISIIR